ncbi:MAG: FGGY family carbohydrate kinase [Patescibacteria group bacterium]|jgi:glycerol kinase
MSKQGNLLVLDAGTTAVKALVFSPELTLLASATRPTVTHQPHLGWAEQDATAYADLAEAVLREVASVGQVHAMAITNQRESVVAWDEVTNAPLAPMLLWQDERTADRMQCFAKDRAWIRERTGLDITPYFSASKLEWLLATSPDVQVAQAAGRLRIGTVDSWLLARLTEERRHVTDPTNAARTLLYDIRTEHWDDELALSFHLPLDLLPTVQPTRSDFGTLRTDLVGSPVPVRVVIGDQQASLAAAGFAVGTTTVTHGTGTFLVQALGSHFILVPDAFTTLAASETGTQFALEVRVGEYARRVDTLLSQGQDLAPVLEEIASATDTALARLPMPPSELVVTGGISQDARLVRMHAERSGLSVRTYATYHGTALGAARLVRDAPKNY